MNVIDSINLVRKTAVRGEASAVIASAVPVAHLKVLLSVKEIISNTKHIKERKIIDDVSNKLLRAAIGVANKDRDAHPALDDEEKGVLQNLIDGTKAGARFLIKGVFKATTWVLGKVFRHLVFPVFRLLGKAVLRLLPMLFSPAGLMLAGVGLAGWGAYELYKRFKRTPSGADEAALPAAAAAGAAPVPEAPAPAVPELTAPEVNLKQLGPIPQAPKLGGGDVSKLSTTPIAPISKLPQLKVPEAKVTPKVEGKQLPLGIRNNNPGNLRYAGQPGADPKSGAFAMFPTQGLGLYNLARQIGLHYYKRRLNTVRKLIEVWAPPNENNTAAYVASVARQIGLSPDQVFDFQDPKVLAALMRAIIIHENGINPYNAAQIDEAAKAAMNLLKDNELVSPASGVISSVFGPRKSPTKGASTDHRGIDIANKTGTPIQAATAGTVVRAGTAGGYGNLVDIKGGAFYTRYGHLDSIDVKVNDVVTQGQKIGEMGNTGVSSGSHLHFEVRQVTASGSMGGAIDPLPFLGDHRKGGTVVAGARPAYTVASVDETTDYARSPNGRVIKLRG